MNNLTFAKNMSRAILLVYTVFCVYYLYVQLPVMFETIGIYYQGRKDSMTYTIIFLMVTVAAFLFVSNRVFTRRVTKKTFDGKDVVWWTLLTLIPVILLLLFLYNKL